MSPWKHNMKGISSSSEVVLWWWTRKYQLTYTEWCFRDLVLMFPSASWYMTSSYTWRLGNMTFPSINTGKKDLGMSLVGVHPDCCVRPRRKTVLVGGFIGIHILFSFFFLLNFEPLKSRLYQWSTTAVWGSWFLDTIFDNSLTFCMCGKIITITKKDRIY